jgi:hypothetical protein
MDWGRRLDAGARDDETLELAAELEENRPSAPAPPADFKADLRRQLLDEYEDTSRPRLPWLRPLAGTAVAVAILAVAVVAIWLMMSGDLQTLDMGLDQVGVARPAKGEIVYDRLLVGWSSPGGGSIELVAESWQTADNERFRGQVTDAEGNLVYFSQSDGQQLWRTYQAQPNQGWGREPLSRLYRTSAADYRPPQGDAVPEWATTPPFYSDLGLEWVSLAMLQTENQCASAGCLFSKLYQDAECNEARCLLSRGSTTQEISITRKGRETLADGGTVTVFELAPEPTGSWGWTVKIDERNWSVVEWVAYVDDTVRRRVQRLERQRLQTTDLPAGFFSTVPDGLQVNKWQTEAGAEDRVWITAVAPEAGDTLFDSQANESVVLTLAYELASAPEALLFVELAPGDWSLQSGPSPTFGNNGQWLPIQDVAEPVTVHITVQTTPNFPTGLETIPDTVTPVVRLILRDAQTSYAFHQQELEAHWIVAKDTSNGTNNGLEIDTERMAVRGAGEDGLPLRESPGGQEIVSIPDNASLTLMDSGPVRAGGTTWRQVLTEDGHTGWVEADFLVHVTQSRTIPVLPDRTAAIVTGTGGAGLRLRQEPNGEVITVNEEGSLVLILDDVDPVEVGGVTWRKIQGNGGNLGWAMAEFLDIWDVGE